MKPTPDVVYRFLSHRYKGRVRTGRTPRMTTGLQMHKHLRYAMTDLRKLNEATGISSMGPATNWRKEYLGEYVPHLARRYAKYNAFITLARYFFKSTRRSGAFGRPQYFCIKDRPFRKGVHQPPRR